MKADAARLRAVLAKPPHDIRLYLFHGPDEAGAAAAASALIATFGPDAERIDLDGATLRRDPAQLADEAASLSLFGGARVIRLAPVGEEIAEAVAALLAAPAAGTPAVAIAPTVRATGRLVKLAIESSLALAHAFYEPSAAEAERIAAGLARELGLLPEPGTAARIAGASGNDRAIMARELDKLALFLDAAPERPQPLAMTAIDALGADWGEAAVGALVAAVIDGEPAVLGAALEQAAGSSPVPWLRALGRRLTTLVAMQADIERGDAPDAVMKRHRVFAREERSTLAALRRWSPSMLAEAQARVLAAERAATVAATAGGIIADRMVVALARAARR